MRKAGVLKTAAGRVSVTPRWVTVMWPAARVSSPDSDSKAISSKSPAAFIFVQARMVQALYMLAQ